MTERKDAATIPTSDSSRHLGWLWGSPAPARRHLLAVAGVILLVLFGIVVLFLFDPQKIWFFPRCPLFLLTGVKCPGCGTARALHAALHGHFAEAVRFNMALPALLAIFACCFAFPRRTYSPAFAWLVFVLVVAWGVGRNIFGL